jgi:exopolysaccharide biosynthesis polyprenyl glycosylphosphotransferase
MAQVPSPRRASDRLVEAVVAPERQRLHWTRRVIAALVVGETLAAAVAAAVVVATRLDAVPRSTPLLEAGLALVVAWPGVLALTGAYSPRLLGTGSDEYRLVGRAGLMLLALAGFASYAGSLDLPRSLVVGAIPLLTLTTLVGRHLARHRLRTLWSRGRCTRRVVLVGRGGAVLHLAERLDRERFAGLRVVAACVTASDRARVAEVRGLPVGGLDDVLETVARHGADTVAVTTASETADQYLRSLSWQLEGTGVELLVAPGLVEVAGPRLHIRPFEGLPLLAIEQPRFEGGARVVKGLLDRTLAVLAVVLLAPVLLAIALAVKATSPGPVFYRQERIGRGGHSFRMIKFRSMVVDAEARLTALREANVSDGLLFKVRDDPRVTPLGKWLRRYSLDELPQLFNVLHGSMSLVGPRPPLPSEVARYDSSVSRRLLVKPGLTGLWQISGRSDLPWEETVRLDLRYVENWSLALDALILWKTGRAVLAGSGAY